MTTLSSKCTGSFIVDSVHKEYRAMSVVQVQVDDNQQQVR
ncbi:Unknown protein sequence [Pseudomonas syringae pv. cilantro]|uniref:Uncharacterized protein n=1 Tax=Pseudomonas syringae pv. cilantro TaxID=81035 RepID=A0A0N0XAY8_PSESX|nr:Unknown protein sequence [Pseudomonas syringae pv. cilantro]